MPEAKWHTLNCPGIKILLLLFYSHVAKIRWRAGSDDGNNSLTLLRTSWNKVSLKKFILSHLATKFPAIMNPNVQYCSLLGYDTLQLPKWLPVWNNLLPPSLEYKSSWECYIHQCHHMVLWPRRPQSMFSLSLGPLMVNNTELQRPSVHNCHNVSWKYVTQIKRCCWGRHTYSERYDNAMFLARNFLYNVDIT